MDLVLQAQTSQNIHILPIIQETSSEPARTVHTSMKLQHSPLTHGSSPKLVQLSHLS